MTDVIVVPHTHWDREWYLPFERYRYFMVRLIDELLDILKEDREYAHFLLDGQAILLEDYLEIRSDKEDQLRAEISSGRIGTGPWYTMPDEFLVSGEAIIRNLLEGHRIANRFGGPMRVGYLPDPFGHISQMPQILKGFGIESACMMRGVDQPAAEFYWEAPDGSRVLTHWFSLGYGIGRNLSEDPAEIPRWYFKDLGSVLEALEGRSTAGVLLLMNGNDHLRAQPGIPSILRVLSSKLGRNMSQGTLQQFFDIVTDRAPELSTFKGEMRSARHLPILPGVLSSRTYLKQRNDRLQNWLVGYAEPVASLAWLAGAGYPRGFLRRAWKLLLQNHFHDSICASSIDQVHLEMMTRFDQAEQIIHAVVKDHLPRLVPPREPREPSSAILVFNPTSQERSGRTEAWLQTKAQGSDPSGAMEPIKQIDLDGCVLVDEDGAESALKVEGVEIIPQDILDHEVAMEATRVTFVASAIPPVGYKIYHLQKRAMTNPTEDCIIQGLGALENTYYRVSVQAEGTLEITDKESGEVYAGLGYFEDSGDRGDEYNYDPPENQFILDTRGKVAEVSLLEDEKDWGTIGVRMGWELPAEVSPDRRSRSVKKIPCEIVMEVSLQRGVKRVDLRAEVDNRARDHRLRVSFPTGIRTTQSIAQSAFDVVRRPVDLPGGTDWAELPSPTHPTSGFVAIEGEGRGLAVFGKGLREYEVTPEGQIYLTLLRSVGWLSRGDLKSRPGNAGPPYETPGAQCMGRQVFEYAVMPYQGGWLDAGVHHEVQRFNLPPLASEVKDGDPGQRTVTFLEVEPGEILISALKLSEEHDGLTLRLCNLSETQMEGSIRIGFAASKAFSMDLNESDLVPLPLEEGTLPLQFRAKEIKTVLLVP